ncbi:MAG: DUF2993 domain-containing protein [Cyanophyceae cyanobacterium]
MEWVTIILASLLAAISPAGLILDSVLENRIRSQIAAVEQLEVRIDNAPSYQILQGKIERLRIASRGLEPIEDLRIEALELETDPMAIDWEQLQSSGNIQDSVAQLQGGVRLVLTETDLNQALQSPLVQSQLQQLLSQLPGATQAREYELVDPRLELDSTRLRIQAELKQAGTDESLRVSLESGLEVSDGHTLLLVEPKGTIDGRPLSQRLLQGIAQGISQRFFDLRRLEEAGIVARLLQLDIQAERLKMAAFIRVEKT